MEQAPRFERLSRTFAMRRATRLRRSGIGVVCAFVAFTGLAISLASPVSAAGDDVGYTSLQPARLLDTRAGSPTIDGAFAGGGALGQGGVVNLTVVGRGNVPTTGVGAVVLNVTATSPTASGFVTVYPYGAQRPNASNLNFVTAQTTPNLVITKVGANGQVALFNSAGNTHLVADVVGWFPSSSSYTSLLPARLLDTRAGSPTIDGAFAGGGALGQGGVVNLTVVGRGNVPATGVGAVVLNVTATSPTASGFVTVYPTGTQRPNASNLNFVTGQTTPNLVITKVGANGQVALFNSAGNTHLIADVVGWFPSSSSYTSLQPARLLDTRAGSPTIDGAFAGGGARWRPRPGRCREPHRRWTWQCPHNWCWRSRAQRHRHQSNCIRIRHRLPNWHATTQRIKPQLRHGTNHTKPRHH